MDTLRLSQHYIPEDMIIHVLSWLPVKSLLRFKTVSKAWLSLITNSAFIDFHLRHATSSQDKDSLIANRTSYSYSSIFFRNIDSSTGVSYFEGRLSRELFIVGSYNGVVCAVLKNRPAINQPPLPYHLYIFLWNPATRQSYLLPPLVRESVPTLLGFGFDPIAKDFKVVRITHDIKGVYAVIYSSNTDAWKYIQRPEIVPRTFICDACVKGVLYWTLDHGVMRFDLNNEVFYNHRFPANVQKARGIEHGYMRIIEMKDSIAVVMNWNDKDGLKSEVNLWTADDGIEEPWTLKFSFNVAQGVAWVHGYLNNRGTLLFKTKDGVWLSYNSDKNETEIVIFPFGTNQTFRHNESLVSIRRSEQVGKMLRKMNKKDREQGQAGSLKPLEWL